MPCNNITELMRVVFDNDDRLKSYRFLKKTCGGAVGAESLLEDCLKGCSMAEIGALHADTFCNGLNPESDVEEFLNLKHFFGLRSVIEALSGQAEGGGPDAACTIAEISCDTEGLVIDAEISVSIVAGMIKACNHCSGG